MVFTDIDDTDKKFTLYQPQIDVGGLLPKGYRMSHSDRNIKICFHCKI